MKTYDEFVVSFAKKAMYLQTLFHHVLAGVANETMPGNIYHNYGDMQQSFEMRKLIEFKNLIVFSSIFTHDA